MMGAWGSRRGSNNHRSVHVEGGFGAVVFDATIPFVAEEVESDGVGFKIHDVEDFGAELNEAGGVDFAFEHGVLNALAVVEAGFGGTAEAAFTAFGGG